MSSICTCRSGCDLNTPEGWLVSAASAFIGTPVHRGGHAASVSHGDENSAQGWDGHRCAGLLEMDAPLVHRRRSEEAQHRARGSSAWKATLDMESVW